MAETKWARVTQVNTVRALGGLTLLGGSPIAPEIQATAKELERAVKTIAKVPMADVIAGWEHTEAMRLKKNPDAKPTPRELLEMAVAIRWGCSRATLRAVSASEGPTRRRFRYRSSTMPFFLDLKAYGRAKWTKAGVVVPSSIGKGPDVSEYLDDTPPGSDARCNHRASL
jgi:hypothetical protein